MKKAQFGRSILEVLSVLVIIALITVAGIHLWHEARLESQTHTLVQRLTSIKNSRLLSMNAHAGERMPRTEKGPYDTIFTIENGVGNQNKDWFWIDVKTNSSSLCGVLAEFDMGAQYIEDECESNSNVIFYFLKFPETDSSTTPDKDNQPRECPPNTNCDNDFNPIGCVEGYFLSDGHCIECPENSIDCKDNTFDCESGYYKNGNTCTSCGTGVVTCDEEGNPTECEENFYLSNNTCVACAAQTNCLISSNTTDSNGCPITAQACTSGVCKTDGTCASNCNTNEYNSNGYCCAIGQKWNGSGCVSCSTDEQCGCSTGMTWNGSACACPENSSTTVRDGYQIGTTGCYCNEGYELNGDKTGCIKISPCKGDMCCQNLFDAGFEVDTTCSSSVYNCSTQKDNTFFMYKPSSGVPYPIYKGDMTVNKDLSAPTCRLLLKDDHFTANANIELESLTSDGLILAAGKTITAESVAINDGEILIESGATLNAELSGYSSSEVTTTLINRGTIKDVYSFPTYVENYGEIYGDGASSNGKELINEGTLHAEGWEFEKIENSGTIILPYAGNYNAAGYCPSNVGILNNSGTIEAAGCIDTAQFQQTAGSVITPGLYIGSNSENKDNPLVMSGGKLAVDNLYIFGDKNGPRLSGNSELIINSDYEYDDFTGIDLYISDNAMMQISPSDSSLALRKFKMTGGVLKVPLLQIWGDFQQTGGEIYVCQPLGNLDSVQIESNGELSLSGGFIKASGYICDYTDRDHTFCYSKSSDGNYYNPHLIPNTDIPWCSE